MKLYDPIFELPKFIKYKCPICAAEYDSEKEAVECLSQKFDVKDWKIGELVLIPSKWSGWYEGDKDWIACITPPDKSSTDHFDHLTHYHGWWVITNITPRYNYSSYDRHSPIFHVVTKYWLNEKDKESDKDCTPRAVGGWTTISGSHCSIYRAADIPKDGSFYWRMDNIIPPSEKVQEQAAALVEERMTFTQLL